MPFACTRRSRRNRPGEEGAEAYFMRKTGEFRREELESDVDEGEEIRIEAHGTLIA